MAAVMPHPIRPVAKVPFQPVKIHPLLLSTHTYCICVIRSY
jgi:hypothetical protein